MKINISQVPPEGLEINEDQDTTPLEVGTADINFVSPLRISCKANKFGNILNVKGAFRAKVKLRCSRCNEKFLSEIKGKFERDYPLTTKDTLDITDGIREEVILAYPLVLLCKKNCKGLCPQCGKNLNKAKCSCKAEKDDERLDKLKDWKKKRR